MNKYSLGWLTYYIGAVSIAAGSEIYASAGSGLIWGGICMIAAGFMQVTLDK
jgi:hypothetical protein